MASRKNERRTTETVATGTGRCETLTVLDDGRVVFVSSVSLRDDEGKGALDRRRLVITLIEGGVQRVLAAEGDLIADWWGPPVAFSRKNGGLGVYLMREDGGNQGKLVLWSSVDRPPQTLVVPFDETASPPGPRSIALSPDGTSALLATDLTPDTTHSALWKLAWDEGHARFEAPLHPFASENHPTPNGHYARGLIWAVMQQSDRTFFVAGADGQPSAKSGWNHLFELDPDLGRRFLAHVPKADVCLTDGRRLALQDRKTRIVRVIDCTGAVEAQFSVRDEALHLVGVSGADLYFIGHREEADGNGNVLVKIALDVESTAAIPPSLPPLPRALRGFGPKPVDRLSELSVQPTYCNPKKPAPPQIWEGVVGWALDEDPTRIGARITHVSIAEGILDFHRVEKDKLAHDFNFALSGIRQVKVMPPRGDEKTAAPVASVRVELTTGSGLTVLFATETLAKAIDFAVRQHRPKNSRPLTSPSP